LEKEKRKENQKPNPTQQPTSSSLPAQPSPFCHCGPFPSTPARPSALSRVRPATPPPARPSKTASPKPSLPHAPTRIPCCVALLADKEVPPVRAVQPHAAHSAVVARATDTAAPPVSFFLPGPPRRAPLLRLVRPPRTFPSPTALWTARPCRPTGQLARSPLVLLEAP